MRILRRIALWGGGALLALLLVAAIPVAWIETQCVKPRAAAVDEHQLLVGKEHQRRYVDTFLTYPEWSIVHAYQDFALVAKRQGEFHYSYTRAVGDYWRGLCAMYGEATAAGEVAGDMRAMLHIIGLSFSAEMLVKGNWEYTIGLLSTLFSTETEAPEDTHSRKVSEEYGRFLVQTPWYAFPFGKAVSDLWAIPFVWDNPVRSIERRIALTMEWGGKALYAKAMGAAAGLAPAELKMRSVFKGLTDSDIRSYREIRLVERMPNGDAIIETPRYRAFTDLAKDLAQDGRDIVEIGGNRMVLVTIVSNRSQTPPTGGRLVFEAAAQSDLNWPRYVMLVPVSELAGLIRRLDDDDGAVFEHIYDY